LCSSSFPFPPDGGEGKEFKDEPSRSFFLDTSKGLEIQLLLLEGELHPASFIRESNLQKSALDGPPKRLDRKGTETDAAIAGRICPSA